MKPGPSRFALPHHGLGKALRTCPLCDSSELNYEFVVDGFPVCACAQCQLLFLNPSAASDGSGDGELPPSETVYEIHSANATKRLNQLVRYLGREPRRLLLIGNAGYLQTEAIRRGCEVVALSSTELESGGLDSNFGQFCGAIFDCSLQQMSDPLGALAMVRSALPADGAVMVIVPTLDSRTARLFRSSWWEFHRRNRFYFNADTLQSAALQAGFGDPILLPDDVVVSLRYFRERLAMAPRGGVYILLRALLKLSPGFLRDRAFRFLHTRTILLARPKPVRPAPLLSVVMPAYNEERTFHQVADAVLLKEIEGLNIELIIVESNSTDSTREQALQYQGHPRVRLILQDRPQGKGNAVRAGLDVARGDIILIQDADLEYDIGDYDQLIKPLIQFRRNFVIGSRHTTDKSIWKLRRFNNAAGLAVFFNLGHIVFLTLLNILYQQRLKDPFSMFKVFRRDCLYGLTLECDRFDFDFEITIKLLRKGYRVLELPVNYCARSLSEGKKVRVFRDPITWLKALVKYRNSPLYGKLDPTRALDKKFS